ncbi:OX-2 membrane glycoprotein isoform 1-T1 [Leptodactylus fuscus]|uniref:OX-2 membrane glycoprotein-like n=1 Tax=Leptodactylus fuscus TaxID=238119 RepID=UPI003F4EF7ED
MEETKLYIVLACQLWILCGITSGLDVKSEVGRTEYEEPVTLKCSLQPPNTAVQVTWTKVVGDKETPVATYTSSSGAEISKGYKHRLWMSTEGLNQNAITLYKANIEDQACYRCIFSTLSQGSKKGEMCLTIPGEVLIKKHYRVRLFDPVTLKCYKRTIREDSTLVLISWQKNGKNIATYEQSVYIVEAYQGLIDVTTEGMNVSSLTILRANVSDEGSYKCLFNIFPGGATIGETSLQVYEPLNVTVLKSQLTGCAKVTCVARSWPPAKISWLDVDGEFLTDTTYDGFLTVTSWIMIGNPKKMPRCKVLYMGEESLIDVSAGTRCQVHPLLLGLLLTKIFFL